MKKILIGIFILISFFEVISCKSLSEDNYQNEPLYVHLSDEVIIKTAKELKNEKNIYLIGHGGQLMYDVKKLFISFTCDETIAIKEARNLIVYSTQKFLFNINSNEQLRPYLHISPFHVKDIDLAISFDEIAEKNDQTIDFVSIHNGQIIYDVSDEVEVLKTIHKESYEEALKIVGNEKYNL